MCLETYLPIILFEDDSRKILRLILRDTFVANIKGSIYYIRTYGVWRKCSKKQWLKSIYNTITTYSRKYAWDMPDSREIDRVIASLYRHNPHVHTPRNTSGFKVVTR